MDAPFAVGDDGTGVGGLVAAVGAIPLAVALVRCLHALAMCNAMESKLVFRAFFPEDCNIFDLISTLL